MNKLDEMLLFTTLGTISGALQDIVEDQEKKELLREAQHACVVASLGARAKVDEEKNGSRKAI